MGPLGLCSQALSEGKVAIALMQITQSLLASPTLVPPRGAHCRLNLGAASQSTLLEQAQSPWAQSDISKPSPTGEDASPACKMELSILSQS